MAETREKIAKRHITEQQRKIKEHEARMEALKSAGHLSPEQRLHWRLKAFERYLKSTDE
jgi:hypothetical protein